MEKHKKTRTIQDFSEYFVLSEKQTYFIIRLPRRRQFIVKKPRKALLGKAFGFVFKLSAQNQNKTLKPLRHNAFHWSQFVYKKITRKSLQNVVFCEAFLLNF